MDIYSRLFGADNEYFNKTGKPIYMDENYFRQFHYSFVSEREQARKKKGKCIMPDCNKRCVLSHTIPESAVLKRVSHKKDVYYPAYDAKLSGYVCKSINIGKASAFPGFCVDHEKLFSGFEISGDFKDPSIALQNLRIVFRYMFEASSLLKVFRRKLSLYKNEITSYQQKQFDSVKHLLKKEITLESVEDEITEHLRLQIDNLEYLYAKINNEDLIPLVKTLEGTDCSVTIFVVHLDCEVPVCLAGKSEFQTVDSKYTVHLSVFPSPGKTFCCFSLPEIYEQEFIGSMEKYKNDLDFLKIIESWMIRGTDFWYINPMEWESYSKEKQEKILTLLKSNDNFPDEELDFTIFDNLRAELNKSEAKYLGEIT